MTLILALRGIERVADTEVDAVETVLAALSTEDVTLLKGVIAKVKESVVACGVENVGEGKADNKRLVFQQRLLDGGCKIPLVLKKADVAIMSLTVEL